MNQHATIEQNLPAIDAETAMRVDQEEVRSLALTTAKLFSEGNRIGANATIEKMFDVYLVQMRMPLSKAWSSLPSLGSLKKLMVEEYASFEGISERQAADFDGAVDARARQVFERHIPRLKEINNNPAVTLDTMQDCVGNIMYERDKKVEELAASASGVLGRIRSRFMAQKGGDWNEGFMKGLDSDTFARAVAHSARNASLRAARAERSDPDSLKEIGFLANLAEQHAGQNQHVTLAMVSDVRYTVANIEASSTFSRPFGQ
ncbi:hypothetical protein OIU34_24240 [Pararhizobium sp. BT-229]|uniref:hypothetical protein n=1 Tax=Pararhizobium sp. BT-229 TaxID=2986923 RepID=UPI0021F7CC37|nr:hypothetical protein [Pararhizobium sp. BT-229]MCV9965010.1 hypothetical protein [Pararhizobium sp. BT-229]